MTYTGRQYQISTDTAPPVETNPAVVRLTDDTDVQVIRIDTGTGTTPTPASASDPLPVSAASLPLPSGAATADNQTNGTQQAKIKETVPTDATKNNAALTLSYTGDNLTTISKVISGVTYSKTLSYSGSVLTAVSAWVQA